MLIALLPLATLIFLTFMQRLSDLPEASEETVSRAATYAAAPAGLLLAVIALKGLLPVQAVCAAGSGVAVTVMGLRLDAADRYDGRLGQVALVALAVTLASTLSVAALVAGAGLVALAVKLPVLLDAVTVEADEPPVPAGPVTAADRTHLAPASDLHARPAVVAPAPRPDVADGRVIDASEPSMRRRPVAEPGTVAPRPPRPPRG